MTTVNHRDYLLFQAKRRLVPTVNNIPGMGLVEKRLVAHQFELTSPDYQARWDYGGMPVAVDGMPIVLRPLG
jgi:hypothetical protein